MSVFRALEEKVGTSYLSVQVDFKILKTVLVNIANVGHQVRIFDSGVFIAQERISEYLKFVWNLEKTL